MMFKFCKNLKILTLSVQKLQHLKKKIFKMTQFKLPKHVS